MYLHPNWNLTTKISTMIKCKTGAVLLKGNQQLLEKEHSQWHVTAGCICCGCYHPTGSYKYQKGRGSFSDKL